MVEQKIDLDIQTKWYTIFNRYKNNEYYFYTLISPFAISYKFFNLKC